MEYKSYLKSIKNCGCGEDHNAAVKDIIIKKNAIDDLPKILMDNDLTNDVFIVSDTNTYNVAGKKVAKILKESDFNVRELVLDSKWFTHPDEKAVGTVLFAMEPVPKMIISVGSGSITDLCRFCASRVGIPYIVVATAPSMDGYVSTVIPITKDAVKISIIGKSPEILIGDLDILENSPKKLLASGFGDMVGKVTAKLDWMLSAKLTDEPMCDKITAISDLGVEICFGSVGENNDDAVKGVMDGLLLSGIAMQLNNNSRPASGSEHHISHFIEMMDILEGGKETLHGEKVGVASFIIMRFYEKLFLEDIPKQAARLSKEDYIRNLKKICPKTADSLIDNLDNIYIHDSEWEEIKFKLYKTWDLFKEEAEKLYELRKSLKEKLKYINGYTDAKMLGYEKKRVRDAVFYARTVRVRFTILTLLDNFGLLKKFTDEVLDEIYN